MNPSGSERVAGFSLSTLMELLRSILMTAVAVGGRSRL
jgi:hypothetical protein